VTVYFKGCSVVPTDAACQVRSLAGWPCSRWRGPQRRPGSGRWQRAQWPQWPQPCRYGLQFAGPRRARSATGKGESDWECWVLTFLRILWNWMTGKMSQYDQKMKQHHIKIGGISLRNRWLFPASGLGC
jgi:hypothetical protein